MPKLKILIAEDHSLVRRGLRLSLQQYPNFEVVGECSNGAEVMRILVKQEVDMILMDVAMPEMDGVKTTRHVLREYPHIKVLAVTMHSEEYFVKNMLRAGALGYILKDSDPEELIKAINCLAEGRSYLNRTVTQTLVSSYREIKPSAKLDVKDFIDVELTQRERQIVRLVASEFTNKEIADRLDLSARTVDSHRRNILHKTGARNTAGLVRYAILHNLVGELEKVE